MLSKESIPADARSANKLLLLKKGPGMKKGGLVGGGRQARQDRQK
jgi:hypothetical protein